MTAPVSRCPGCQSGLRPGARFCVRCGLEVRQLCPACVSAPRWLAGLTETAPWCETCESLLDACERCGRWLLPSTLTCPDPQCAGRVLPVLPRHTGRRWDAKGSTVGWSWPPVWERAHPAHQPPRWEARAGAEPLHGLFIAHGRLYLWHGTNLQVPDPANGWTAYEAGSLPSVPGATAEWSCTLGPSGLPALLPFAERAAVVGGRAVLALERRFVQVDLRHSGDVTPLPGGAPIAQVGGPGWWLGWSEEDGRRVLRAAKVADGGHLLAPEPLSIPEGAELARSGSVVLRESHAYWPGRDGGAWRLDCLSREIEQVIAPGDGSLVLWAEPDGPRAVRENLGQLTVGLSAPAGGRIAVSVPAGAGPLRGVFALREWVSVVGERVTLFHPRTGERLHEVVRPRGQWIAGALAPAEDGEPRLLALTMEGETASLIGLRISSGVQELLWRGNGVEPRALLPVGGCFLIAHTRGVLRAAGA